MNKITIKQQEIMERDHIIAEIQRTARENGNAPLGRGKFKNETGITESHWTKHWARWGDALLEAGYKPNEWEEGYDEEVLIEKLIQLIQEINKFPTLGELKLKSANDQYFPSHATFKRHFGKKHEIAKRVYEYCRVRGNFPDVQQVCFPLSNPPKTSSKPEEFTSEKQFGYVYLMKSGTYYTIGKSDHTGRRSYEHERKLPEKIKIVHTIKTDDPFGVESYWGNRFMNKKTETKGSWYKLNANDIRNFKRWKKIF